MLRCGLFTLVACLTVSEVQSSRAADCYDLAKGEPQTLTGTLDYVIFPGPPNFKDVQRGDTPEPNFVLRLPAPICVKGDEFADPANQFSAVQVLGTADTAPQLREFVHKTVTLKLKGPLAAQTGHHHEPLVAWVTSAQLVVSPQAPDGKVVYGSALSTVRSFYEALGQGDGGVASLLIAPEKRQIPAFSASAMSDFYGKLQERIQLVALKQDGPDEFVVQYHYASVSRACDGTAIVTTSSRGAANYIDSIKALDGC